MPDYGPLIEQIQGIAERAVAAGKPAGVVFGTVRAVSPLVVITEQKLVLGQAQLVLARNVTDHWITMTVDHLTEVETCSEAHSHGYKGTKKYLLLNGLSAGEKVVLLREQGGQRYIILDRVVGI